MTLLVVLTVGFVLGRLWAAAISSTHLGNCPKCALNDREQRTRIEMSAIRRQAEERMAHAAATRTHPGMAGHEAMSQQNWEGQDR